MRTAYEERLVEATQIDRRIQTGTDKIVRRNFGAHARLVWPFKTSAHIAAICNVTERHAARILSGEFEAPPILVLKVMEHVIS